MENLRLSLTFLSKCVTTAKFPSAAREASWGRFHSAVINQTSELQKVTESAAFSSWLCLRLFTNLLKQTFPMSVTRCASHSDRPLPQDEDIVVYIGGSVVAKLRKAAFRLIDEEKAERLDILSQMVDLSEHQNLSTTLTDVLDRGGLVRLNCSTSAGNVCGDGM